MDPLTVPPTDPQAKIAHIIHHLILDQISKAITGTQVTTIRTDKTSPETTTETAGTNRTIGMIREIIAFKTGMTTTKIENSLTVEEDQTNTNTTETNQEHR